MAKNNKTRHNIRIKSYRNKRIEETAILKDAIQFFLDDLLKRCTLDHKVNVELHLKKGKEIHSSDGSKSAGLCGCYLYGKVVWYTIEVGVDVPFLEMLSTIAHESVHIAQYVTGRLNSENEFVWDGIPYGEEPYTGTELDSKLPWEYDAYSKEPELAKKFVKKYYSNW